jgi:hypothetical protein
MNNGKEVCTVLTTHKTGSSRSQLAELQLKGYCINLSHRGIKEDDTNNKFSFEVW